MSLSYVQAFGLQALRLVVWLALLAVIFTPLERLFALRRTPGRWKTAPADIAFYFLNSLLPLALLAPPLAVLSVGLRHLTPHAYVAAIAGLPVWAKLAAGLAVSEVGGYWGHRLSHEIPLLWRFHAVHHAPEHVDWLISSRAHPVDQVFEKLCALAPLYILGLVQPTATGAGLAGLIAIFGTVWGFFVHANVRWRLGPLEQLVSTPAFHHWHHTNDAHRDHNYAALFPVVDRLFGTYHLPKAWPPAYGVDAAMPEGMLDQLLDPFTPPKPAASKT
ncbi:sterol desaturase family protein [Phenylobacterium sp.]|uniref:sterol desaturase family protein n=1 Tax=Phenylobacterium sp. TaxID=1871053 RepID=UPI002CD3719A|nr:sterol desaturase family protein [Phenylobacterium sp.]HLZ76028.1 sterol desaturase family protein [Phenylobacterium sp.]